MTDPRAEYRSPPDGETEFVRAVRVCSPQMALTGENTYGGGVFHLRILEALADQGTPCLIPLAFKFDHQPRRNWDVRIVPVRRTYKLGPVTSNAVFILALLWYWFVRGLRFDLLRVTDPYYIGPAALVFHAITRVPLVANIFHIEHRERFRNAVLRFVTRRCDAVIVTSRFSKDQVVSELGLDPALVHVTYGGFTAFPGAPPEKRAAKRLLGLHDKTLLGFIGAVSDRKNPGYLLEVFADLVRADPNRHLVVIGADDPRSDDPTARLRRRAQELGLSDHVTFAGRVDSRAKALWLSALDLFVFPSLLEGFGLAVAEAMAAGVPAVVSDRGSLPEIVEHGVSGLVLPLQDRRAFADAVDALLKDTARLAEMGEAAKRRVTQDFTWEACARETHAIHERVTETTRRRRLGVFLNAGDGRRMMEREGQRARFEQRYLPMWERVFDRVDVFGYDDSDDAVGAATRYIPGRPRWRGLAYALAMPFLHRRRIRQLSGYRVMQAGAALPAVLARLIWRRPMVVTYGYEYGEFMRRKGRRWYAHYAHFAAVWALRKADAVICTTAPLESRVRAYVGPGKSILLPNGVDVSRFKPNGETPQPGRVLFVGRLSPQKNLDLLADAVAPLKDRVELVLAGDGPERNGLERRLRDRGVNARFLGTVVNDELPPLYRSASVFVLTSLIEGHPKALIEAMACGCPCVGTDVEGIHDVLRHEETGLLVEPRAEAVGAAIERLLNDEPLRCRLGENAREYAQRHFDLAKTLAGEERLWRRLLGEAR